MLDRVHKRSPPTGCYQLSWVLGTRAEEYYGPVVARAFLTRYMTARVFDDVIGSLLRRLQEKAEELGAHCVVGVEISLDGDKLASGYYVTAEGTAATLSWASWCDA